MDIETIRKPNGLLVNLKGRMDVYLATEFDRAFEQLLQGGDKNFVLNLGGLEYVSSAGLRSILGNYKKVKAGGGKLLLCGLGSSVKEVFEISGFASIFQVFNTPENALANL
jgi:anti-anti-sigma factor